MKIFIDKLKNKQDLSFAESKNAFEILMNGKASDDEIFDFLKTSTFDHYESGKDQNFRTSFKFKSI